MTPPKMGFAQRLVPNPQKRSSRAISDPAAEFVRRSWAAAIERLVIHAAHATHSAAGHWRSFFLLRKLGDDGFSSEQQARDRGRVLQGTARDLRWIDDARLYQVGVFAGGDVVAFVALARLDFLNDERAFLASVIGELSGRLFDRATHDLHAQLLVAFKALDVIERFLRANERDAAARDNAFLNRRARSMQGVFHASFLLFHLCLSGSADVDNGDTAREFRQTLLELFAIVIARRLLDLTANLIHATLDIVLLAFAFDNGGVFLIDGNALGFAKVVELHVLELDPEIFRDATTAGQHCNIFQHRLTTIAEARSLDRANLQGPAQLVHDQGGERFAFHIFCDNQERTTSLRYFFK